MTITIPITDYQRASFTLGENPEAEAAAIMERLAVGDITSEHLAELLAQLIALATQENK